MRRLEGYWENSKRAGTSAPWKGSPHPFRDPNLVVGPDLGRPRRVQLRALPQASANRAPPSRARLRVRIPG